MGTERVGLLRDKAEVRTKGIGRWGEQHCSAKRGGPGAVLRLCTQGFVECSAMKSRDPFLSPQDGLA